MPRCVTNWEQRTAVAAGKAMHIHKTTVGGTATFFPFFSHSFSTYPVLSLLTYTITPKPTATYGKVGVHTWRGLIPRGGNAQQPRKADTTVASFFSSLSSRDNAAE